MSLLVAILAVIWFIFVIAGNKMAASWAALLVVVVTLILIVGLILAA